MWELLYLFVEFRHTGPARLRPSGCRRDLLQLAQEPSMLFGMQAPLDRSSMMMNIKMLGEWCYLVLFK